MTRYEYLESTRCLKVDAISGQGHTTDWQRTTTNGMWRRLNGRSFGLSWSVVCSSSIDEVMEGRNAVAARAFHVAFNRHGRVFLCSPLMVTIRRS